MLVADYLEFVAELRDVPKRERFERIRNVGRRCGLKDVAGKALGELSKGFRQRVGLAQAMVHDPDILILDEPTSGLDPNQIVEIRELIRELGREKTVILSTHILPEVQATCDRVLIITDGKIAADGKPQELQRKQGGVRVGVTLRAPSGESRIALSSLPGVREVWDGEATGTGTLPQGAVSYTVKCGEGEDPREQIFHLAVQRGWVLLGMSMEQVSLEEVFRKLTRN
jgi:ABC-2 type transport system ATP-binding protein